MKRFLYFLLLLSPVCVPAQNAAAVFTKDSIVYYGLDFSRAKLIGDFGNGNGLDLKTKMFPSWNEVVALEQTKYDLKKSFRKRFVYYDLVPVSLANDEADENKIRSYSPGPDLTRDDIDGMVRKYAPGDKKTGLGLVLIIQEFDKNSKRATAYVTFFDIATGKVLLCEKTQGSPGGVGLRNYWANSIYDILKAIDVYLYDRWQSKNSAGQ